jgi:hypothetical protein
MLKHKCPLFPERRIFNVKPGGTQQATGFKRWPLPVKTWVCWIGNAFSDTQSRRLRRSVGVCRRFRIREERLFILYLLVSTHVTAQGSLGSLS